MFEAQQEERERESRLHEQLHCVPLSLLSLLLLLLAAHIRFVLATERTPLPALPTLPPPLRLLPWAAVAVLLLIKTTHFDNERTTQVQLLLLSLSRCRCRC